MYTQCPQCRTFFQVTTEHLKIAQGNVRCGQCRNVFSALGNLSETPPDGIEHPDTGSDTPTKPKALTPEKKAAPIKDAQPPKPETSPAATVTGSGLSQAIEAMRALNQASAQRLQKLHDANTGFVAKLKKQLDTKSTRGRSMDSGDSTAPDLSKNIQEPEFTIDEEPDIIEQPQARAIELPDTHDDINFDEAFRAIDELDIIPEQDIANKAQHAKSKRNKAADEDDIRPEDDATHLVRDYAVQETYVSQISPRKEPRNPHAAQPAKPDNKSTDKTQNKKSPKQQHAKLRAKNANQAKAGTPVKPASTDTEFDDVSSLARAIEEQNADELFFTDTTDVEPPLATDIVVFPDQLLEKDEHEHFTHDHFRSSMMWGAGSLALMILFLFQSIYFKHNELGQIATLRPWIESFCKHTNCQLELQSDLAKLELLGQDIRSHPKIKEALLVSATIINNASFTQRFPGLTLSFSDLNGEKVASRHFLPKDYLKTGMDIDTGMVPNTPVHIDLEMLDPGNKAVNFEFDFFLYK